ncbi:TetR/AcrR family transcriptional regulator [Pseudoxanthomonas wuyuanensis]|uniref:TetR/AcrR family transcriptional regulator n=1 Tax=Pseudoxanthomonas wuyuanensis TaxID=1073196 RepID=UPI00138A0F85|nr:TetR/AcrR family transcriptional regulator [Pseudoxanthomonas wuyuanensis]
MTCGRRNGRDAGGSDAGTASGKRLAVLRAAQRLIASNGLELASMDAVARCAGVSKATVYAYFRSKDALFRTALDDMIRGIPDPRESLSALGGSLHARLTAAAQVILDLATAPTAKGLHRAPTASRRVSLRRASRYWDICFGRYDKAMQEFLKRETARGQLAISDYARASSQFLGLIAGAPTLRALLIGEPLVPGTELSAHVNDAVGLFIRGYQPTPGRWPGSQ